MPDPAPPRFAQDASGDPAQALTPESIDGLLADFRTWLEARAISLHAGASEAASAAEQRSTEEIDLHTLLGQFIAVRHEVNLQTRAVRAQQEQNAETLRQLTAALDALQQNQAEAESARRQTRDEAIRPLLQTLVELYDALARAESEVRRSNETMQTAQQRSAPASRGLLFRFFHRGRDQEREPERERERQMLASLLTGYKMSLQRIERALRLHGLEAIPAAGERFDPEHMEVLEAVTDSGRPAGEVLEEIRRGFLWNGRVFRYAQVRVAKS